MIKATMEFQEDGCVHYHVIDEQYREDAAGWCTSHKAAFEKIRSLYIEMSQRKRLVQICQRPFHEE